MATINASIKMQNLASTTLEQVSYQVDAVEQSLIGLQDTANKLSATDPMHSMVDSAQEAVASFRQMETELNKVYADARVIGTQQSDLNRKIDEASKKYGNNSIQVQKLQAQMNQLGAKKDQLFNKAEQIEKSLIKQGQNAKRLTDEISNAQTPGGKLSSIFETWGGKILAINQGLQLAKSIISGIGTVMKSVDEYTLTNARLNMINDNLQTQEQLQDKIYAASERSRTSYQDMASIIGKIGISAKDAFDTNDQQIAFAELLNKSFKISGADDSMVSSAMYNLNQALSSGVLMGNDFRAISENAPMLADAMAEYMGVTRAELKELSSQGVITSDVIKGALFNTAEDINTEFEKLPRTFQDASTSIQNNASKALRPLMEMLSELVNSEGFMMFINVIIGSIATMASIVIPLLQGVFWVFEQIGNAVMWIGGLVVQYSPIILTTLALIAGYLIATYLPTLLYMIYYYTVLGVQAIASGISMAWAWITALHPAYLIIGILLIIITVLRAVTGSFEEAGGIIGGVFGVLGAFIYNSFIVPIWNYIAAFANFFANVFNDPVYSIKKLFVDVFSTIVDIVKSAAGVIDFVLGTDMAGAIQGFQDDLYAWLGESDKYVEVMPELEEWSYSDAWDTGKTFGSSIGAGIDSAVSGLSDMLGGFGTGEFNPIDSSFGDMSNQMSDLMNGGGIPTNVKGGKLDVDISDEDLKYLRDVAQQQYTLKYKQITPNINLNVGDINEAGDGKNLIKDLQKMLEEQLADLYVEETA